MSDDFVRRRDLLRLFYPADLLALLYPADLRSFFRCSKSTSWRKMLRFLSLEGVAAIPCTLAPLADAIVDCPGFAVALAYVLSLPVHKHSVADRPVYPLDWDRKAWSMLDCDYHATTKSDMLLDPGNVVLACCTQALMCRAGAVVESRSVRLCEECDAQREALLAHFKLGVHCVDIIRFAWVYAQQKEELLQVEEPLTHAKLQAMSDVMEAAWGICHKSTPESKVMQEHLASESGVGAAEFVKAGVLLRQLVWCCQRLTHNVYSTSIALDIVVRAINPPMHPAHDNEGCLMCASKCGLTVRPQATGEETTGHRPQATGHRP